MVIIGLRNILFIHQRNIPNGFIWSLWVFMIMHYNLKIVSQNLFNNYVETLLSELDSYDTGYWSLYEHSAIFKNDW